jgi:hypothetical protein
MAKQIKEEERKEEVVEVVKKPASVKPIKKVKIKMNVQQFCNSHGILALDMWVANKFFPNSQDKKSVVEWKKLFDEKKIAYKS